MNILVACEESQRVCTEFRRKGHNAFSCDIEDPSGGHPEWHIKADALSLLNGNCIFETLDMRMHYIVGKWDMLIAFPPCTYLTVSGNRWFNVEKYGYAAIERQARRLKAIDFFLEFVTADIYHIAIENPIGVMSRIYRKPDCIIQPWQFGEPYAKHTCLWLKNLPVLKPTHILQKPSGGWINQHFTNGRYSGYGGTWAKKRENQK